MDSLLVGLLFELLVLGICYFENGVGLTFFCVLHDDEKERNFIGAFGIDPGNYSTVC